MPKHFDVTVREGKKGLVISRDKYALINKKSSFDIIFSKEMYEDNEGKIYKDEWCENHQKECLENYDLNMLYFKSLDKNKFDNEIMKFLKKYKKFHKIENLNVLEEKSGYYIMVLDNYRQLYIGTSNNMMKRIRQHWSTSKQFDRLLFPMGNVSGSILSIDSFRAYDTTRIYAFKTSKTYINENKFIEYFSPEFLCNRLGGGKITGGFIEALSKMKEKKLIL